ncbi:hypothetical protein ACJJTC_015143 [Scirpophaga incertulas]
MYVSTSILVTIGIGLLVSFSETADRYQTIHLNGTGFGNVSHKAAFSRIQGSGDMFWWFYPTLAENPTSRPLLLWLDGVVGLAPSMSANFGMIGPYDFKLKRRNDSWVNDYNLLFVDAPLGSGFSTVAKGKSPPKNLVENTNHLILCLESFYKDNKEYSNTPVYIFGQGYGAQMAVYLALGIPHAKRISANLKGVVLGSAIISPAKVFTKLGFYLEELGYIDGKGRKAIEEFSDEVNHAVTEHRYEEAYRMFLKLEYIVNKNANAVSVNLERILDKMSQDSNRDYFGQLNHLQDTTGYKENMKHFMDSTVAPALGISNPNFDSQRKEIIRSFRKSFMIPAVEKVEEVLNNTNIDVIIYNGNLDAVSNTLGQLEWVFNLQWSGQANFLSSNRVIFTINNLLEGYVRKVDRLAFYWINIAGLMTPLDSPIAMKELVDRTVR